MNINIIIICVCWCSFVVSSFLFPHFSFLFPISDSCIAGSDYNQVSDEKNKAANIISFLHLVKKVDIYSPHFVFKYCPPVLKKPFISIN